MRIGGSLLLIAIGAILKWAITDNVKNVDLGVIGVILMVVGLVGLIFSIIWMSTRRRTEVIHRTPAGTSGTTYVQPNDGLDY
ncbi:DUF6458 family protein [Jatrophihabitans cynanchi]|jgi:hypothetical protein|uniref:DUF6458 family protein n=1 Tax=Jatrophihabitans cynanchi TaxID=2944128 RepID=A0ABY7JTU1_9ACTN|nr:DUF6458 family protein [Jatrophihabitans sp. SB3-54]WAX55976.1 DUF6458 family protein [Jatrophihabitans sp. SB3-54]